jgi:hypothetical protein
MKTDDKGNVIDMTSRIQEPDAKLRLKGIKVRLDLEQAKIAISTSLLSVVILVTLANNNMMNGTLISDNQVEQVSAGRGIASVQSQSPEEIAQAKSQNAKLVSQLSEHELSPSASIGRKPSSLEALAFGYLEGKYAVRMQNGKISEIEFSDASGSGDHPKHVEDLAQFLMNQRDLLPVDFDKTLKIGSGTEGAKTTETYQLMNQASTPVANVQFHMDAAGRLLAMQVQPIEVSSSASAK